MARHERRRTWTLWDRRSRAAAEARGQEDQAREYQAAVARILAEPTRSLPVVYPVSAPLLTPGQAARADGSGR